MAALPASAADLAVAHQIALIRYSNRAVQRIIAVLNRTDASISARLMELLERAPESATAEYLADLLDSVRLLNNQAYAALRATLEAEMLDVAGNESQFIGRLYAVLPEIESVGAFAQITAQQAYTAAFARPFQGRLLSEWAQSLSADRMIRIRDAVRVGYLEGQTTQQIVRTIRGTRAAGYADGLLEIDRRNAESVVRTALSHTAQMARSQFYDANKSLLGSVMWLSTLDGRTSAICRARDHKRYTVETHRPIGHTEAWLQGPGRSHWRCRSTSLALLKGQEEFFGTRAAAGGPVSANLTYNAWLKRQPASVQDDVLGPARGKLFRDGGFAVEDFVNDKGRTLTLAELKNSDAEAFRRAGVN